MIALVTDITERKRQEEQISLLMREVNHRSKNILTLVQAIARQTAASQPADFLHRFDERVRALAASQDLLVKSEWTGADLAQLIRSQLAHFKDFIDARIALNGPDLVVTTSAAQALGMALHELATNAGKYGALSNANEAAERLKMRRRRSRYQTWQRHLTANRRILAQSADTIRDLIRLLEGATPASLRRYRRSHEAA